MNKKMKICNVCRKRINIGNKKSLAKGSVIKEILYTDVVLWARRKDFVDVKAIENELNLCIECATKYFNKLKEDGIIEEQADKRKGNKIKRSNKR